MLADRLMLSGGMGWPVVVVWADAVKEPVRALANVENLIQSKIHMRLPRIRETEGIAVRQIVIVWRGHIGVGDARQVAVDIRVGLVRFGIRITDGCLLHRNGQKVPIFWTAISAWLASLKGSSLVFWSLGGFAGAGSCRPPATTAQRGSLIGKFPSAGA